MIGVSDKDSTDRIGAREGGEAAAGRSATRAAINRPRAADRRARPARRPALDLGIIDQGRRVVRLDPRVDDQRAGAAPVLLVDEGPDPLDVGGRDRNG